MKNTVQAHENRIKKDLIAELILRKAYWEQPEGGKGKETYKEVIEAYDNLIKKISQIP